ncbi:MAG: EAL domain-containing protein [Gemmatimonadetes bacterium]|nr:EAL domain-containing protein [Gemmatimonadota bacterium]
MKHSDRSRAATISRDSHGLPLATVGHLYLWYGSASAREKVRGVLDRFAIPFLVEEGDCVVARVDWLEMRALIMPLRRNLTHMEASAISVLFKADGKPLSPADIPRVKSYTQFAMVAESQWLTELLDEERFTSVLQNIVHSGAPARVFAREALLRGIGRDESIIHPVYLFDAARGCGMLDRLELAARRAAINRMLIDEVQELLFVNVTPNAIEDQLASLNETIAWIDTARIPHARIVFEIVESDKASDLPSLQRLLAAHRAAGFRVVLDDVGAGYSGLNLLHQLRPDFIKLDMELIHGVTSDPYKALITKKILEIASELGIQSIAEGVETMDELAWVRDNGATYAQGFAIARPTTPTLHGRTPHGLM